MWIQTGQTCLISNVRAVWGYYEGIEGGKMIDVILGIIVSLNILAMGHLYFKMSKLENAIAQGIDDVQVDIPAIDELKNDLSDTIVSMLANMHTPTFMDHIGGAIGGLIQARTAKMMTDMHPQIVEEV